MADSLKRSEWAKDKQTHDRIQYWLYQKAMAVFAEETPAADSLAMARKIYRGEADLYIAACVMAANTSIGTAVDAGSTPPDSDLEWAVGDQWANMAAADAAGSA